MPGQEHETKSEVQSYPDFLFVICAVPVTWEDDSINIDIAFSICMFLSEGPIKQKTAIAYVFDLFWAEA